MSSFQHVIRPGLLAMALALSVSVVAEDGASTTQRFELRLDGGLRVQAVGAEGPEMLEFASRLLYDLTRRPREKDVSVHALELAVKDQGKDAIRMQMSRSGISTRRGEVTEDQRFEDAPAKVQKGLRAFDTPAVTLSLDASGREVKRTRKIDGPLAEQFLGLVDSLLSVHVPFPDDADHWEAPARLAMGQGQSAQGVLRFEKVASAPGAVRVKVSGRLAPAGQADKGQEVKNGTYAVSGEQVYSLTTREWRSADWSVEMAFDLLRNGKPSASAHGALKLSVRPAKAGAGAERRELRPNSRD